MTSTSPSYSRRATLTQAQPSAFSRGAAEAADKQSGGRRGV